MRWARENTAYAARALGCLSGGHNATNAPSGASVSASASRLNVTCMQHAPVGALLAATDTSVAGAPLPHYDTIDASAFGPVVDGAELTDHPAALLARGAVAPNVTLLVGSNRDEGSIFIANVSGTGENQTVDDWVVPAHSMDQTIRGEWTRRYFGDAWAARVAALYPETRPDIAAVAAAPPYDHYTPSWWAAARTEGDFLVSCPMRRAARALASLYGRNGTAVYAYFWQHAPAVSLNYNLDKAAYHGAEIPYFWQDDFELSGDAERQLAAEVALYLRNFAHSGNPNVAPPTAPGLPEPPVVWSPSCL